MPDREPSVNPFLFEKVAQALPGRMGRNIGADDQCGCGYCYCHGGGCNCAMCLAMPSELEHIAERVTKVARRLAEKPAVKATARVRNTRTGR